MATPAEFEVVFAALKGLMERHAGALTVQEDTPGRYMLGAGYSEKRKRTICAGGVEIRKHYVTYHLMAVYAFPDLLRGMAPALRKRMQGKACFNFTAVDPALMKELGRLTKLGFERFAKLRFD